MNKTVQKFLEEQGAAVATKMDDLGNSETPTNLADYHFLTALMMSIQYLIETNNGKAKK